MNRFYGMGSLKNNESNSKQSIGSQLEMSVCVKALNMNFVFLFLTTIYVLNCYTAAARFKKKNRTISRLQILKRFMPLIKLQHNRYEKVMVKLYSVNKNNNKIEVIAEYQT
uniref:Uncharacterized protein n=1 Tax=Glossina pallidipes TaxID=7398 RepID=A0A1B0AJY1_GLOPL